MLRSFNMVGIGPFSEKSNFLMLYPGSILFNRISLRNSACWTTFNNVEQQCVLWPLIMSFFIANFLKISKFLH